MWIAKFGTDLCRPSTRPITKKYMQNRTSGWHVGPQQPEQRALVARLDLLLHEQPEQVATLEHVDQPAAGERRDEGGLEWHRRVWRPGRVAALGLRGHDSSFDCDELSKVLAHCSGETMSGSAWR